MIGIIPAAGAGTRIQPLAFSKELLPVGSRVGADGRERPRAVSEYLCDRMVASGAEKLLFVIGPDKSDIFRYYGGRYAGAAVGYVVQDEPLGLCDAVFRACPFVPVDQTVVIGLPDTVWFPLDALSTLPRDRLAFLLFPVERPELFDSVDTDADGRVRTIAVKSSAAPSPWIWGAIGMPGRVLHELHALWRARGREDLFLGTLVSAWLAAGNEAVGVRAGEHYVDVGTLDGYRQAQRLLDGAPQ